MAFFWMCTCGCGVVPEINRFMYLMLLNFSKYSYNLDLAESYPSIDCTVMSP